MALVAYSDSESETENTRPSSPSPPRPAKRLRGEQTSTSSSKKDGDKATSLPPLPTGFHDLYAHSTRVSVRDDPSLHGGRKRVIPHVEGNWPTHLYLEWYPSKTEVSILNDILSQARGQLEEKEKEKEMKIHTLLYSDLGAQLPLHISLSRPVVLVTEQRQPFSELFRDAVLDSGVNPFDVTLVGLDWVSNYEKTRWFLVLRVQRPENDGLNRLLKVSNQSLAVFGQPPLYETLSQQSLPESRGRSKKGTLPRDKKGADKTAKASEQPAVDYSHCFHISIAWSLNEPSPEDRERVANVDLSALRGFRVHFSSVKAKIGNNVLNLALPTKKLHERGFAGF
ncbi:hypothetical protein VTN00DRAFT_5390 [Thermoascus crustaceus]|uniref:uncharacterized protein n=1 Tax=Thermoascus crustaceus TaxID=5088 RepID=UPI003743EC2C